MNRLPKYDKNLNFEVWQSLLLLQTDTKYNFAVFYRLQTEITYNINTCLCGKKYANTYIDDLG